MKLLNPSYPVDDLADAARVKQLLIQLVGIAMIAKVKTEDFEAGIVQSPGTAKQVLGIRATFPTV